MLPSCAAANKDVVFLAVLRLQGSQFLLGLRKTLFSVFMSGRVIANLLAAQSRTSPTST